MMSRVIQSCIARNFVLNSKNRLTVKRLICYLIRDRVLLLFVTLLGSTALHSAVLDGVDHQASLGIDVKSVSWLPGENYDTFMGVMNHRMIDMEVKGNGQLPIVVARSDGWKYRNLAGGASGEFGWMALDLPRVTYTTFAPNGYLGGCRDLFLIDHSQASWDGQKLQTPIKFEDGEKSSSFFSTHPAEQPSSVSRFPSDADYISPSNWFIKCIDADNDGFYEFHVFSPSGIQYVMGKNIGIARGGYTLVSWRVTKIIDPYNNTLTYDYEGGNARQEKLDIWGQRYIHQLESIRASDGRRVDFSYEPHWNRTQRISEIRSNGGPNPQIVKYDYNSAERKFTVNYNDLKSLQYVYGGLGDGLVSITYPTGGVVNYEYVQHQWTNINSYCYGCYGPVTYSYLLLSKRTTQSDGGVYSFHYASRGDSTFSRVIQTPFTTIDYMYQKSSRHAITRLYAGTGQEVAPEEQRLQQVANFGRADRDPSSPPLVSESESATVYSYQKLFSVSAGLPAAETDLVVNHIKTHFGKNSSSHQIYYSNYDRHGHPTTLTERNPRRESRVSTIRYQNDGFRGYINGKIKRISLQDGNYTDYTYNEYGDKIIENINGIATGTDYYTSGYNRGQIRRTYNSEGHEYVFNDYHRGIPREERDQRGRVTIRAVNNDGTIEWESRLGDSAKWYFTYDDLQRQSSIRSPRSQTQDVRTSWSSANERTEWVAQGNYQTKTLLDGYGRVIFSGTRNGSSEWRSVENRYDSDGRKVFSSYPSNVSPRRNGVNNAGIRYQYDGLNRVIREITEMGGTDSVKNYKYGADSSKNPQISVIDSRGKETTSVFESFGTPSYQFRIKHTDANDVSTQIERDIMGRVKSINRNGIRRDYAYNRNKLLQSVNQPEDGHTAYEYYSDGMLRSATNNNRKIDYEYHSDNKLDSVAFRDSSGHHVFRDYGYDSHGNLQSIKNNSSDGSQKNEIWYSYDVENNITAETFVIDSTLYSFAYEYDSLSNLIATIYPNQHQYRYNPNSFGEPTQIASTDGKEIYASMAYHPNGRFKHLEGGRHWIGTTQDAAQRPQSRALVNKSTILSQSRYDYQYDRESNVTRIDMGTRQPDNTFVRTNLIMDYDNKSRLNAVHFSNADNWNFRYDSNDDIDWIQHGRDFIDYHYSANTRRLESVTSNNPRRNFFYDARGNTTSIDMNSNSQAGGPVVNRRLTINSADQIVGINNGLSYAYDARGLRIKQILNGSIYTFFDNSNKLRYRVDYGTGVTSEYFYSSDHLIARRDRDISGATARDEVIFFLTDALGSAVAAVDENSDLCWSELYSPYGDKIINSDVVSRIGCGILGEERGYTGHTEDVSTDLVYMQQRYYDPSIGRFLSIDPVAAVDTDTRSLNRYAYGANNPYLYKDPNGEFFETGWDLFSSFIGFMDALGSLSDGRYLDAAISGGAAAVDFGAALIPGVPGGLSMTVKGARAADKLDTIQKVDVPKNAAMPTKKSQVDHIFDPKKANEGHLAPTTAASQNRAGRMFENIASDKKNLRTDLVTDPNKQKAGIEVFTKEHNRGQVWVETRGGAIQGAGVNRAGSYR